MAYIILVENDNSLYGSQKTRIMQKEKLFNKVCFLVPQFYKGYDMSLCTVTMRYLLPISKEFKTETLVLADEKYQECLKYVLPIDTNLTKEWGDIELNLTFTMLDVDDNGKVIQRVRKTDNHRLHITQLPDWDAVVPDSTLYALDQRILKIDAQMKALDEMNQTVADSKADNIKYNKNTNELQLLSGEKEIGDKVVLNVVDVPSDDDDDEDDNVVEF